MMKQLKMLINLVSMTLLTVLLIGCLPTSGGSVDDISGESADPTDDQTGLANPASVHCEEQGGRLEMRQDENGGTYGVCLFHDGSECEEWAYFRSECEPGSGDETAVADGEATPESPSQDWLDKIWILQVYGQPLVPDSRITIIFQADGQFNGSAGCNNYFGGYTLAGESLVAGPVGSTEMWCEDLMDQEMAFLQMLQSVTGLTVADDGLILHTPEGDMHFTEAEAASLEGTKWMLNGIAQNDAVVSSRVDENIFIQFENGEVNGHAGCNNFFGSYEVNGETLTLGQLGQTMMACEEEIDQREAEFFGALAAVTGYRIELDRLFLSDVDGQDLLYFTTGDPIN